MYKLDEIIETKKPHVCKSNKWKVIRIGADIKLECVGCGRIIMIPKRELDKKVKMKKNNDWSMLKKYFLKKLKKTLAI